MKAPLFDKVLKLSQTIASASAADDSKLRLTAYNKLQELCQKSQGSKNDHPLQWEALADFTDDGDIALDIYQMALAKAEKLALANYSASIYLSMAQRYHEFGESEKATELALQANEFAQGSSDEEFKKEINDLLESLKKLST